MFANWTASASTASSTAGKPLEKRFLYIHPGLEDVTPEMQEFLEEISGTQAQRKRDEEVANDWDEVVKGLKKGKQ
jgi:hypothetical protein